MAVVKTKLNGLKIVVCVCFLLLRMMKGLRTFPFLACASEGLKLTPFLSMQVTTVELLLVALYKEKCYLLLLENKGKLLLYLKTYDTKVCGTSSSCGLLKTHIYSSINSSPWKLISQYIVSRVRCHQQISLAFLQETNITCALNSFPMKDVWKYRYIPANLKEVSVS